MNNILSQISDYNWMYAFQCCGDPEEDCSVYNSPGVSAALGSEIHTKPFQRKDVKEILYQRDGDNDGPSWLGIFVLKDGRYAFLSAGCDYTGWDCQSGGHAIVSHSLEHLWQFGIGIDDRKSLEEALIRDIIE